jgi:hypothetical protein
MSENPASALLLEMVRSASDAIKAEIVHLLQPDLIRLIESIGAANALADSWMDLNDASVYAGITTDAMHKHTAAKTVPFEQDVPGGKCWFKRSGLDAWRRGAWRPGEPW